MNQSCLQSVTARDCKAADLPCAFVALISNGKYLAPRERSEVFTAVRKRFRSSHEVPLERILFRVLEQQRNGWMKLQHLMTGRFLRLVPPPSPNQWVLVLERDTSKLPDERQLWFKLEMARGADASAVHVRNRMTGGFINYRFDDMLRGHGNAPTRSGVFQAAGPVPSTRMQVQRFGFADVAADAQLWRARVHACMQPCMAPASPSRWHDSCYKHYAAPFCAAAMRVYGTYPGGDWGEAPFSVRLRWARLDCTPNYATPDEFQWQRAAVLPRLPPPPPPPPRPRQHFDPSQCHCPQPVEGVILLVVADRPNHFLCHHLASALLHGLSPIVLGWDETSWNEVRMRSGQGSRFGSGGQVSDREMEANQSMAGGWHQLLSAH